MRVLWPSQYYQEQVDSGLIQADLAQQQVVPHLDALLEALRTQTPKRVFGLKLRSPKAVTGLYLWGRVGRGKTLLTDILAHTAADIPHQRWHFHRFMNHIHQRLALLPNTADTLSVLAKQIAKECRLLLLDEFFVADIGDAMILYRLLDQLLMQGVSLVASSNVPVDDLYLNGLQRASFLPCIALLKRECRIIELASTQDYRLRTLRHAATYLSPLKAEHEAVLAAQFQQLSGATARASVLDINGRTIPVLGQTSGLVWFSFNALCDGPRSAADYIEIARDFHTVLLSSVPRFDTQNEEPARRFVYLIDELYDRHVNVLLSAEVDALSLYNGQRLQREFERTSSRLIEMQSLEYLCLEHRP